MKFFDRLQNATKLEQSYLMNAPIILKCLEKGLTLEEYFSFLQQAYHHVKHTVPLLMATGSRLSENYEWLRCAIVKYIDEEYGHEEWILNDIHSCGFDRNKTRTSQPNLSTELMISYAYDTVSRVNPLGFFGMVYVLEGTSIKIAYHAAQKIMNSLELPREALTYLTTHSSLDQKHIKLFEDLINKISHKEDQDHIIHFARRFYVLYSNIFREILISE